MDTKTLSTKHFLLTALISVIFSISILNHNFELMNQPSISKIASIAGTTIIITSLIYLTFFRYQLFCRKSKCTRYETIQWLGFCLVICWLFLFSFPIKIPLPPQWHTLVISAGGQKNEQSLSTSVTIMTIQDENEEKLNLESFQQTGNWQEADGNLSAQTEEPSTLTYRFPHRDGMSLEIMLKTGQDAGIVEINLDQKKEAIDLFESTPGITLYTTPVKYSRYFWLILLYGADIVSLTCLLFFLWHFIFPLSLTSWLKKYHQLGMVFTFLAASILQISKAFSYYTTHDLAFDVSGYIMLADKMKHPFDTGIREPLWIWLVKFFQTLPFPQGYGIHFLGIMLFAITGFLLYRIATDIFHNRYLAILTLAIYILNPYVIDIAVQGLRDIMNQLTVVGMTYFIFVEREQLTIRRRIAGLTLFFVLSTGSSISNLAAYSIMLLFSFWKNHIPWKYLSIPWVVAGMVLAPYMVYCQQTYHDAFFAANTHAVYWRNYEFVTMKQTGCPGCPTPEQLAKSSYAGEPTSMMKYVFGLHTLPDLISGTIQGYHELFLSPSKKFQNFTGTSNVYWFYLYLIGLGVYACRYYRHWMILLIPFLVTNLMAYMIFMTGRLFSANTPFIALITAAGLLALFELIHLSINKIADSVTRLSKTT